MKRVTGIAGVLMLATGLCLAQDVKKLSLDDAGSLGLKLANDTTTKVEGAASLRITTPGNTSVCLGEVTGLDVENATLVFAAKVRTELEGEAFLEMWVEVGGGKFFSKGQKNPVKGNADWTSIQTPFLFEKGQKPDRVTLNLVIHGRGTVWIDDVVLSKEPLKE